MRRETAEGGKTKGPGYSKKLSVCAGIEGVAIANPSKGDLGYKSLLWIK